MVDLTIAVATAVAAAKSKKKPSSNEEGFCFYQPNNTVRATAPTLTIIIAASTIQIVLFILSENIILYREEP